MDSRDFSLSKAILRTSIRSGGATEQDIRYIRTMEKVSCGSVSCVDYLLTVRSHPAINPFFMEAVYNTKLQRRTQDSCEGREAGMLNRFLQGGLKTYPSGICYILKSQFWHYKLTVLVPHTK